MAAAALGITAWTGWQGAKLNEQSVKISDDAQKEVKAENLRKSRPYLDFQYRFGTSEKDDGYLRLTNIGTGVAEIVTVAAKFNGVSISSTEGLAGAALTNAAKVLDDGDFIEARNLKIGQLIEGGGKLTLLQISERNPINATLRCNRTYERKKNFALKLVITVTYRSAEYKEDARTAMFEYVDPPPSGCLPSRLLKYRRSEAGVARV